MKCVNCEFENPAQFKFCGQCGSSLVSPTSALEPNLTEEHSKEIDAERRQLTVLFCDLVGSTLLAERLDPEELRGLLQQYQAVCARAVRHFEGHIARYFGDGLLIYFGYPVAHEDAAHRAVRAALEIVTEIEELKTRIQQWMDVALDVRLSIHTGMVVAGDMSKGGELESMAIVGQMPNVAARMQEIAEPNTVVLGPTTYQLVIGSFACHDLGVQSLRGVSESMRLYQVLGEKPSTSRPGVAENAGLAPLVGRDQEVELLLERWEQAASGEGQAVTLTGEPGIGKSRVVQELKQHVASRSNATLMECDCTSYYQNSPFHPIVELFQREELQFDRTNSTEENLGKLECFLTQYDLPLDEMVPLFARLFSVQLGDGYTPSNLPPEQQRQKTLQGLLSVILKKTIQCPVLFIVEDLHWIDPSTLELIHLLIESANNSRIFTMLAYRSHFLPEWTAPPNLTSITLNRLTRRQVTDMVNEVADGKGLPAPVVGQIVAKTDGIPLFVQELTKMVVESAWMKEVDGHYELTRPLPQLAIPTTLYDSLMARLDRLGTAKEVAQLAATLGRDVDYELLKAISWQSETLLRREMTRLMDAQLLDRADASQSGETYTFRHALIQETAYQSLLKDRRQRYHQQIASTLIEQFPDSAETQPELIAHHYTAAMSERAIPFWQHAGQRAIERSANLEGINHLLKGLELIKALPETPERMQQEFVLQITLGPAMIATKGYGAPEVASIYARAQELGEHIGETTSEELELLKFPVLFGLWLSHLVRAELDSARELGERCIALARQQQDVALMLEAHRALGATLFYLGELGMAHAYLEEGIAQYQPQHHRSHAFLHYMAEPGMTCLCYAASTLWFLGYPERALRYSAKAQAISDELPHPFSQVVTLFFATFLYYQCHREADSAQAQAEKLISLSTEHGFPIWRAAGVIMRGWALSKQGQFREGIDEICSGLGAWRSTGAEIFLPFYLGVLAQAYARAGQIGEGLKTLDTALDTVAQNEERLYEAELYRLKGELLLMDDSPESDVEGCFRRAIRVASHQGAKTLELRASASLSRLYQCQGKTSKAREILAQVHNWFTEGFDTTDLREAEMLLEELS